MVDTFRPEFPHPLRKAVRNSIPRLPLRASTSVLAAPEPSYHGARSLPSSTLSDIALAPRTGDFQRAFDRRSPVRLRPSLRLSGDTGKLCVELSALFLSLAGRPLPARVPVCEWPRGLTAGRRAAAAVFAGLKEAAAVIVRAAPRSPRGRAGHGGGGGKSKVGKGPQERNFRFNGQLRLRQQLQQRGAA